METPSNIRTLLEARAADDPTKGFLFSEADSRQWTYAQFDRDVNRTANLLLANGVKKGDTVSLLMPNSAEYVIAYFACFKLGAVAGPINSLLKPAEVQWAVLNSEAKIILAGTEMARAASLDVKAFAGDGPPVIPFDNVADTAAHQRAELAQTTVESSDDAIIIYTSGTTGKPKGCLLTHGNLIANARQITEWLGFNETDRLLTIMPLFHMNAVTVTTMTALYCGGSTVIAPKFSASRFWKTVDRYKITSFGSVATMLSMLLNGDGREHEAGRSLRFAMCGSAPVPAEVLRNFEEKFGCLVVEGYGLSESTCRSTFNPPNEARRPGSCGLPIGNEMNVFDENDRELPAGELGEIVLRGPNIFKGYFKDPAATEKAFANGWFHTGDIGYRDDDGYFYIADRKSDMIIRGGENIYPREVDDLLYTHPAVEAAAVIGVPDELYGEEVAAFVVIKEGMSVTENDLIEFCKDSLADFKCPKSVHFVADIPKGPTGKLLKRELANLYAASRPGGIAKS